MVGILSDLERHVLETAMSDRDLSARLKKSEWLHDAEYQMPPWLEESSAAPIVGIPCVIPHARMAELDDPSPTPATSNETRLVRNKVAIKQLANELSRNPKAKATESDAAQAAFLRSTTLKPFYRRIEEDHNTIVQLRQQVSDAHAILQRLEKEREQILMASAVTGQASFTPSKKKPLKTHTAMLPALAANVVDERALNGNFAKKQSLVVDGATNQPSTINGVYKRALVSHIEKQAAITDTLPTSFSRTPKRKATAPPDSHGQEVRHLKAGRIFDDELAGLAVHVLGDLRNPLQGDSIEACGTGPLSILLQRPRDALALAHKELHTSTPDRVKVCWRRLYEDATLSIVAQLLHNQSMRARPAANTAKRVKLTDGVDSGTWVQEIVGKLDQAIIIAGAPGRRDLINAIFDHLDPVAQRSLSNQDPQPLVRGPTPRPLNTKYAITRPKVVMTQAAFAHYVDRVCNAVRPLVMQGVMADWPAMELWHDLLYLKRHTMAGHRLVPVEVGKSYTDHDWGQEIITFSEFAERFLVPDDPPQTGYLAQYDIFHQIPTLRSDIHIPDYCYSAPPTPTGAASRTKGLDAVQELDDPLLNAWLGPKGTKSPLHTDPYHNILCQVVGYKYVRLYAPEETGRLYPMGADEAGIEMNNTSEVDISVVRPRGQVSPELATMRSDLRKRFPLLEIAEYEEAVLGPGESLYIPLGWWHYVESLTTSISVSFWWN